MLHSRDVKVQEAALNTLAALAKDNRGVAVHLAEALTAPVCPPH